MKSMLITLLLVGSIQGMHSQSDIAYVEIPASSQNTSTIKKNVNDAYKEVVGAAYLAKKAKKLQLQAVTYDIKKSEVYVPNTSSTYTVNFNEGSNEVKAIYGPDGTLIKSEGTFENVPIPYAIGSNLAKKYPGWEFHQSYCYSSYSLEKETKIQYKIVLKKENKTKTVKINPADFDL